MSQLFNESERATLTALVHRINQAHQGLWMNYLSIVLNALVAAFVMAFEWELAYTLFSYIGDEESSTWNPVIMGLSAFVLVLGFHYMIESKSGQKSKRFIEWLAAKVIPIYAIGFGLVVVLLLLKDGLIEIIKPDEDTIELIESVTAMPESGDWLSHIIAHLVSPVAALCFAIGVGTLAILNVFVGHRALNKVKALLQVIENKSQIKCDADRLNTKLSELETALKNRQEALAAALLNDDDAIANDLAAEIHGTLQAALMRPQMWLEKQGQAGQAIFGQQATPNPRLNIVTERVKALEAMTTEKIIQFIKKPEGKK